MFSYNTLKQTNFLGIFDDLSSISDTPVSGNTAIVDGFLYIYDSAWHKITFIGTYINQYSGETPNDYDLICIAPNSDIMNIATYKLYLNNAWQNFNDYDVFNLHVLKENG